MASKKCNYCNSAMNRVVSGMPTPDELENPKPMIEYAGCIIDPLTPKWLCVVCNSQVIQDLNPKSGICLHEAPEELRRGINFVVSRLEEFAGRDENTSELIEMFCPGLEPEKSSEEDVRNHKLHGDCLRIKVCGCQNFDVFLDGFAISRNAELESLYHGHLEVNEVATEFSVESMQSLSGKLTDLYFGSNVLGDLVGLIGESVMTGCQKDFICEGSNYWEILADYWVLEEELFPDYWLFKHNG